jgi:hypothetical protein
MMQELPDVSLRESNQEIKCKNCDQLIADNFCGHCGRPVQLKRVDGRYIMHEIQHVLHLEKGIFYTVVELLRRPGKNVHEFIEDSRDKLVKPVLFVVLTSLAYTVITHLFHIGEHSGALNNTPAGWLYEWMQAHYGYANIIMGAFVAFWLKIFYKKQVYNVFEILILLCFVMGTGMLITAFFTLIGGLLQFDLTTIAQIPGILYCSWAIWQFFDQRTVGGYFKALGAYLLGMFSFSIVAIIVGIAIELVLISMHGASL